jgi:DNA-binding response OmpR family regulator
MGRRVPVVDAVGGEDGTIMPGLRDGGFEVVFAPDHRAALERFQEKLPDLAILDVMAPFESNFDLFKRLKRDPGTASIPVIMWKPRAQDADDFRGWGHGIDGLADPVSFGDLWRRIRRRLRR